MSQKKIDKSHPVEPPEALVKSLRVILRPLVRLLLSFQITFPYLSELLKSIYVEVADKDFQIEGKKQTDTRISLLTGVHRKDTKRLRQQASETESMPATVSVGAQLVAKWVSETLYLDEQGHPIDLPMKNADGASFEGLVQSVCKQDIRARVVLDEWLRLGIVSLSNEDVISLNTDAFIPEHGLEEKAFYFGMNISDHLSAASQNILAEKDPLLERCVYYSGLTEESIAKLKAAAEEQSMKMLKDLNRQARAYVDADADSAAAKQRMNLGVYFYHEPLAGDADNNESEADDSKREA